MGGFDELIDAHVPHLRRYARALTGNVARADDLVQDTLERAWIKFHLWRPNLGLRPWLFTIMHNVYVNQVRTQARRAFDPLGDEEINGGIARPNQADMLEVADIAACLEQLPAEQRETLLLVTLEEMSYQQVSEILGIPIGTVTSRLARARVRLKALIEGGPQSTGLKVIK